MRHKVIESRQEVFNQNEQEVSKRWAFEEGVSTDTYLFNDQNIIQFIFHIAKRNSSHTSKVGFVKLG